MPGVLGMGTWELGVVVERLTRFWESLDPNIESWLCGSGIGFLQT